ncbi:MAG: DUF1127 domain-containing protein [Pseudomonadota bacterium]
MAHVANNLLAVFGLTRPAAELRADVTTYFERLRQYYKTLGELRSLSDRELQDLGMSRYQLRDIAWTAVMNDVGRK